tara:strand:+ start:227 stop:1198 length:972 start_codon:yes stop_codon:yes gene_type:complete
MTNYKLSDYIISGGLLDLNDKNIRIRSEQIHDELYIHTCNDYKNSLEVIREASFGIEDKLKILSKVYYKYPDIYSNRFRPILEQLEEQANRLGFIPKKWDIQICCYCSINDLISNKAHSFFKKISEKFGIKKVFLETYPIYNYNYSDLIDLNKIYFNEVSFGLIGYQNFYNRVFKCSNLDDYANYFEIIFIGILGKGSQNKIIFETENINKNIDYISLNLYYFLSNIKKNNLSKGITNFSSINQYRNFKDRFYKLQEMKSTNKLDDLLRGLDNKNIYYFEDYDHYGGFFNLKSYFKKPRLILSRIKYNLYCYFKFKKYQNNFF